MKLEDCKPGVRVRVYDEICGVTKGTISEVEDNLVKVSYDSQDGWDSFFPQQLRKIVPKIDKPTLGFAFNSDGSWNMPVDVCDTYTVDLLKRQGCSVWAMRGVKKL